MSSCLAFEWSSLPYLAVSKTFSGHYAVSKRNQRCLCMARASGRRQRDSIVGDPWKVLGVPQNASEEKIKKAHRILVKKYHPDARKIARKDACDEESEERFLAIQRAYEILIGKYQGKDVVLGHEQGDRWDFHDWYWSFSMKRRRKKRQQQQGVGEENSNAYPGGTRHIPRANWQQQMQGLKAKAAAKKARGRQKHQDVPPYPQNDLNYTSNDVGMDIGRAQENDQIQKTPNGSSGTSQTAETSRSHEVLQSERQQVGQLNLESKPLNDDAVAAGRNASIRYDGSEELGARNLSDPLKTSKVFASQMDGIDHSINETQTRKNDKEYESYVGNSKEIINPKNNVLRWKSFKSFIDQAAHAVRDAKRHHDAALEKRIESFKVHIAGSVDFKFEDLLLAHVSPSQHLKVNLHFMNRKATKGDMGNEDIDLPSPASFYNIDDRLDMANTQDLNGYFKEKFKYKYDEHDRKFANRQAVEERLSNQLVGLRRRAALKKSFDVEH